jgi:hypothetical protein
MEETERINQIVTPLSQATLARVAKQNELTEYDNTIHKPEIKRIRDLCEAAGHEGELRNDNGGWKMYFCKWCGVFTKAVSPNGIEKTAEEIAIKGYTE